MISDKCKLLLNLHDIFKNHRKEKRLDYQSTEVSGLVQMRYFLIHDSVEETEIADTRRKTQTSSQKQWLILVKEKKNTR